MPPFVSTEKLILFSEIIVLKTTRIHQRERFRSIIRLGVAHCYLLGISQTLCRGVHLSARPSSRSLLSVAPLAPFHFSHEQFLSPSFLFLSSFLSFVSPFSWHPLPFPHSRVRFLPQIPAFSYREQRTASYIAMVYTLCIIDTHAQVHACDTRARIYARLAANLPRISSTAKWYGSPLRSESKRVAGSTHFGRRNSSRFDLVMPTRSIDNSPIIQFRRSAMHRYR